MQLVGYTLDSEFHVSQSASATLNLGPVIASDKSAGLIFLDQPAALLALSQSGSTFTVKSQVPVPAVVYSMVALPEQHSLIVAASGHSNETCEVCVILYEYDYDSSGHLTGPTATRVVPLEIAHIQDAANSTFVVQGQKTGPACLLETTTYLGSFLDNATMQLTPGVGMTDPLYIGPTCTTERGWAYTLDPIKNRLIESFSWFSFQDPNDQQTRVYDDLQSFAINSDGTLSRLSETDVAVGTSAFYTPWLDENDHTVYVYVENQDNTYELWWYGYDPVSGALTQQPEGTEAWTGTPVMANDQSVLWNVNGSSLEVYRPGSGAPQSMSSIPISGTLFSYASVR